MTIAVICIGLSIYHYKTTAHNYEKCRSAAEIASLVDTMTKPSDKPENKTSYAQNNQQQVDNEIACSDLNAQWAMSDIAMLGYIAGLFGLLFLGITVFETKNAADLSRRALDEAERANRRGQRAYIGIEIAYIEMDVQKNIEAVIKYKNFGETPARIVASHLKLIKPDTKYILPKYGFDQVLIQDTLHNQTIRVPRIAIPNDESIEGSFQVALWVSYIDVFDNHYDFHFIGGLAKGSIAAVNKRQKPSLTYNSTGEIEIEEKDKKYLNHPRPHQA